MASQDARAAGAQAGPPSIQPAPTAGRFEGLQTVIKSQHARLPFTKSIERVAVGDPEILSFELINNHEVLVLGRNTGRTTLVVWFSDGTLREYLFAVHADLSVLQSALSSVHPSIQVESAPDRDAVILTGIVPNVAVRQRAEEVAQLYLDARRSGAGTPLLTASPTIAPPGPDAAPAAGAAAPGSQPSPAAAQPFTVNLNPQLLQQVPPSSGKVINLIQVENAPALPEEKITAAIQNLGGRGVTIRRVLHGNIRDDARDTLVLEGSVPNQIALVRILEVAAQIFAQQTVTAETIHVVGDEAGGLAGRAVQAGQAGQNQSTLGAGGTSLGLSSSSRGARLNNEITRNIARAKAIEVANGRILSFIEVADLPQVRIGIRLLEVNRTRLRSYTPESALLTSNFRQPSLNPARSATVVQDGQAARVGGVFGPALQEVLSFLGGAMTNQLQFTGAHIAVDSAVSLLEREGIVHTLSSPALTVLSGELAQFQVGGEIPITIGLAPFFGTTGAAAVTVQQGAFTAVDFVAFGIQLGIRPLVGEDDSITLDVQPQVVLPDASLTDAIRQSTGTNPQTTAFQTRALRTSSRLQDGQTLLVGGLRTDNVARNTARTPGLNEIPALGWLFKSFSHTDEATDLVVMVNPAIVRTRVPDAALWAFPDRAELLRTIESSRPPTAAERRNP